jgi:holo-[acyl-carrier protein] synthase
VGDALSLFGIGTDLCDIRRVQLALDRRGERFARKVLGAGEWRIYEARSQRVPARGLKFLATRFAAKEAFAKAIGLGIRHPMRWRDCEVLKAPSGQPIIVLNGDLAAWFAERRLVAHVTLTDEGDYAAAFVVVEQGQP